jgi:hypothetical protein
MSAIGVRRGKQLGITRYRDNIGVAPSLSGFQ